MKKLLIVEDDDSIRESLVEFLTDENYLVKSAIDGENGLEVLKNWEPNLIISDIMMPKMDGYQFYNEIRKRQKFINVPFIFLTAKTFPDEVRKGMNLGADDYITKPFKFSELINAIQTRIDRISNIQDESANISERLKIHMKKVGNHEFNTPIHAILSAIELLENQPIENLSNDEYLELLDIAKRSTLRLQNTLNNLILNFYDLEDLKTSSEEFDIKNLIENAITNNLPFKEELNRINIKVENAIIFSSKEFLKKIILEIVDNGLKFSGEKVNIIGRKMNDYYFLSIADNGIGMTAAELEKLDSMEQINRSLLEQQGMGLGLHITKKLLAVMGINFQINSEKDIGTQVELEIKYS